MTAVNWETIQLLNNKFHGLSPSGGHHSLLFDQGLPSNERLHTGNWNAIWRYFVSMRYVGYLVTKLRNYLLYIPYVLSIKQLKRSAYAMRTTYGLITETWEWVLSVLSIRCCFDILCNFETNLWNSWNLPDLWFFENWKISEPEETFELFLEEPRHITYVETNLHK